jgi:hypothetical protein
LPQSSLAIDRAEKSYNYDNSYKNNQNSNNILENYEKLLNSATTSTTSTGFSLYAEKYRLEYSAIRKNGVEPVEL